MKGKSPGDMALYAVTTIAASVAIVSLWRAGVRPYGKPLDLEDLDHMGSFLSGILTPVGLAWAARGLALQRTQIERELEEAGAQRKAAEHAEAMARSLGEPELFVARGSYTTASVSDCGVDYSVNNNGAGVRKFRLAWAFYDLNGRLLGQADNVVNHGLDQPYRFATRFPSVQILDPSRVRGVFIIRAERMDMLISEYVFKTTVDFRVQLMHSSPAEKTLRWDAELPALDVYLSM